MVFLVNYFCDKYFRWFDSGNLQGGNHLRNIVTVARSTPHVRHWLPTREAETVRQVNELPENLVVRVSGHTIDSRPPRGFPHTSTVVTHGETRPAPAQSNACGDCRACWDPAMRTVAYGLH